MARMPRELEAFGEQVARILNRFFPGHMVEMAGPLDLVVNDRRLSLDDVYRLVQCEPSRGMEIVEHYIERLMEADSFGSTPLPLSQIRARIMPRIQPMSIFDHLDAEQVAYIPFVNQTAIVFVIDMSHMTISITMEQLTRWGVTVDDLDNIARANLARYMPELEVRFVESTDGGRAAIVAAQDGYDAARLLLPRLHEQLAPELNGDFFVATPARDMFLALTCEPAPFVERLHREVSLNFKRLPYPITQQLFVVTRDGVAGTAITNDVA